MTNGECRLCWEKEKPAESRRTRTRTLKSIWACSSLVSSVPHCFQAHSVRTQQQAVTPFKLGLAFVIDAQIGILTGPDLFLAAWDVKSGRRTWASKSPLRRRQHNKCIDHFRWVYCLGVAVPRGVHCYHGYT